jgi:hypothetical protein
MPRRFLYLVIWCRGQEEKFYVDTLKELFQYIEEYSLRYGCPPDLVYRKE